MQILYRICNVKFLVRKVSLKKCYGWDHFSTGCLTNIFSFPRICRKKSCWLHRESERERERTGYISETVSSVPVPVVSVLLVVRGGTWRPGAGLPPLSPQTRLLSYCHIVRSREDWGYILLFETWSSSWSNIPASNQTSLRFDWKLEILVFYLKLLRSKCVPK